MTKDRGANSTLLRVIEDEVLVIIPQEDCDAVHRLNEDQAFAYNLIIFAIQCREHAVFFVNGLGGTGKTYLYRALLATLRSNNHIVLATATSGIAATILPGGRTAHSRFKILLNLDASSTCSISKQSDLAELIRKSSAIILDEAPMMNRYAFEALDRTFKDITGIDLSFGGKVMIFGGIFDKFFLLSIKFLLQVGNGERQTVIEDMIQLPSPMVIPWEGEESINQLVNDVFPNLNCHVNDVSYMVERAIITPENDDVDVLNEMIIKRFPGPVRILHSFDSVEDDTRNMYQKEFFNSISPSGMPPHQLTIKKGAPIMLLRYIDPNMGLCNGTRLTCRGLYDNLIDAEILTGQFAGTRVFFTKNHSKEC